MATRSHHSAVGVKSSSWTVSWNICRLSVGSRAFGRVTWGISGTVAVAGVPSKFFALSNRQSFPFSASLTFPFFLGSLRKVIWFQESQELMAENAFLIKK
jgi:hypothetical protein